MSVSQGVAGGVAGRRPHRVGLACLGRDERGTARLLLDDLAAATRAYERHAGIGDGALELVEPGVGAGTDGADALVVALCAGEKPARLPAARPGARVYAIVTCEDAAAAGGAAGAAVARLEELCGAQGLAWSGALVVGNARLLPATWPSPRLGWLRRPVSEAVDALVLALRTGSDAGLIRVRPSLARRIWAAALARLFSPR